MLGAFLLSDEITLVKPETELKDVKDVSSEILNKLELLGSKNSTEDLVRQFDYVENAELEDGFRSASRELANELSSFIKEPNQLDDLIRQLNDFAPEKEALSAQNTCLGNIYPNISMQ